MEEVEIEPTGERSDGDSEGDSPTIYEERGEGSKEAEGWDHEEEPAHGGLVRSRVERWLFAFHHYLF